MVPTVVHNSLLWEQVHVWNDTKEAFLVLTDCFDIFLVYRLPTRTSPYGAIVPSERYKRHVQTHTVHTQTRFPSSRDVWRQLWRSHSIRLCPSLTTIATLSYVLVIQFLHSYTYHITFFITFWQLFVNCPTYIRSIDICMNLRTISSHERPEISYPWPLHFL